MADGWCCPKCGRCYAPWVAECLPCNGGPVVTSTSIRMSPVCTCGQTSGPCPVHPDIHTSFGGSWPTTLCNCGITIGPCPVHPHLDRVSLTHGGS